MAAAPSRELASRIAVMKAAYDRAYDSLAEENRGLAAAVQDLQAASEQDKLERARLADDNARLQAALEDAETELRDRTELFHQVSYAEGDLEPIFERLNQTLNRPSRVGAAAQTLLTGPGSAPGEVGLADRLLERLHEVEGDLKQTLRSARKVDRERLEAVETLIEANRALEERAVAAEREASQARQLQTNAENAVDMVEKVADARLDQIERMQTITRELQTDHRRLLAQLEEVEQQRFEDQTQLRRLSMERNAAASSPVASPDAPALKAAVQARDMQIDQLQQQLARVKTTYQEWIDNLEKDQDLLEERLEDTKKRLRVVERERDSLLDQYAHATSALRVAEARLAAVELDNLRLSGTATTTGAHDHVPATTTDPPFEQLVLPEPQSSAEQSPVFKSLKLPTAEQLLEKVARNKAGSAPPPVASSPPPAVSAKVPPVVVVQRAVRRWLGRVRRTRIRSEAMTPGIVLLQSVVRRYLARKRYAELVLEFKELSRGPKPRDRNDALRELLALHRRQDQTLANMIERFFEPLDVRARDGSWAGASVADILHIFGNARTLFKANQLLLRDLETATARWPEGTISPRVCRSLDHYVASLKEYVRAYANASSTMLQCAGNREFADAVREAGAGSLEALLEQPIQVMPRFISVFDKLKKSTTAQQSDYSNVAVAHSTVRALRGVQQEHTRDDERIKDLYAMQQSLSGDLYLVPTLCKGWLQHQPPGKKTMESLYYLLRGDTFYRFADSSDLSHPLSVLRFDAVSSSKVKGPGFPFSIESVSGKKSGSRRIVYGTDDTRPKTIMYLNAESDGDRQRWLDALAAAEQFVATRGLRPSFRELAVGHRQPVLEEDLELAADGGPATEARIMLFNDTLLFGYKRGGDSRSGTVAFQECVPLAGIGLAELPAPRVGLRLATGDGSLVYEIECGSRDSLQRWMAALQPVIANVSRVAIRASDGSRVPLREIHTEYDALCRKLLDLEVEAIQAHESLVLHEDEVAQIEGQLGRARRRQRDLEGAYVDQNANVRNLTRVRNPSDLFQCRTEVQDLEFDLKRAEALSSMLEKSDKLARETLDEHARKRAQLWGAYCVAHTHCQ